MSVHFCLCLYKCLRLYALCQACMHLHSLYSLVVLVLFQSRALASQTWTAANNLFLIYDISDGTKILRQNLNHPAVAV